MRRFTGIAVILTLMALALSGGIAAAQSGLSVTCDNGASFSNGVEIVVNQMRSGFDYTATAVGLNGFDPVLAVLDTVTGQGLCSDDEPAARSYGANLPSTGSVPPSNLSAQVTFSQNSASTFADISLVVGGFGDQTGEFILILEGMAVTSGDGAGDPFSINLTPGMVASGVPVTTYMLTRGTSGVDPLMFLAASGSDLTPFVIGGQQVVCDDAGTTNLCFGESVRLDNYNVTIATGTLPGWQYDAMLSVGVDGLQLDPDRLNNYLTFVMTSYQQSTEGQYLLVFHVGTVPATAAQSAGTDDKGSIGAAPTPVPPTLPPPQTNPGGSAGGLSVTCDNGASFSNGVEIVVNQMRSGFDYTATAVGLNGFDPVLAVLDTATGRGLCSDDEPAARSYGANLPSTGSVPPSNLSAQVTFSQNSASTFADISLVVGGLGDQTGEFILILEGMGVTSGDGAGDPFSINITPGMVASGVPLTVYMLTRGTAGVDPLMFLANNGSDLTPFVIGGQQVVCDDAGTTNLCFGESVRLDNYNVTIATGTLPGWQYDAMLSIGVDGLQLDPDRLNNYLTFVMTSYQQSTEGQYLLVFHIGTVPAATPTSGQDDKGGI
jgi:hypothetical protein